MKDAWKSGMNASADYYDRMSQYNKDTRGMSRKDRNRYYRDRNREDGCWHGKVKILSNILGIVQVFVQKIFGIV